MIRHLDEARVAFFDVDGVLLDSLPQHLAFCRDKAREYGLENVKVPSVSDFRKLIGAGVRVSPMYDFFVAVGFPPHWAEQGVADYDRDFLNGYRPRPFDGIAELLGSLDNAGFTLGLVTLNVRANVEPALGRLMRYFEPRCTFYYDSYPGNARLKSEALKAGAQALRVAASDCIYVGDQTGDWQAADAAGFLFVPVTYGWGFAGSEPLNNAVDSPAALQRLLIPRRHFA
ncbi:HAD family hydrolase [Paraburkholderia antibiotica]|uniref:phosphoglycolate phosphatase n=1 Tax=Paraburkholderia antibiotica TaxID=2728839 RepID=A0A7X9X2C9_9BURK|nr:HAD hydrolase-like protein [Paraburkholderia antibiotica]NML30150.1 HAD family hydrolase [Paraburkholderia antibiotica]